MDAESQRIRNPNVGCFRRKRVRGDLCGLERGSVVKGRLTRVRFTYETDSNSGHLLSLLETIQLDLNLHIGRASC